jgi:ankyrin repeat protein
MTIPREEGTDFDLLRDEEFDAKKFIDAAGRNDSNCMQLMSFANFDIDATNERKQTALHKAARMGHHKIVKLLVDRNANINVKDKTGVTPMMSAAAHNHKKVIKLLLSKTIESDYPSSTRSEKNSHVLAYTINAQDNSGMTAVMWAIISGHASILKKLVKTGVCDVTIPDRCGRLPLTVAAKMGHVAIVKILLGPHARHVNVNAKDSYGNCALLLACLYGHTQVVQQLLTHRDIDLKIRDNDKNTALILAASKGYIDIIEMLLKDQVTIFVDSQVLDEVKFNNSSQQISIHTSAVNLNARNKFKQSALIRAAWEGHVDVVLRLLQVKPLILSDISKREDRVRKTIEMNARHLYGAQINAKDENGYTPLASKMNHHSVVTELMKAGCE